MGSFLAILLLLFGFPHIPAQSPPTSTHVESWAIYDAKEKKTWTGGSSPKTLHYSASVGKVMVAYTLVHKEPWPLDPYLQEDLEKMIKISDNEAAHRLRNRVGGSYALQSFADTHGFQKFNSQGGWSNSLLYAPEWARFWMRVDPHLTAQKREYMEKLFSQITPSQRWGVAAWADDHGWKIIHKSGWRPQGSRYLFHQTGRVCSPVTKKCYGFAIFQSSTSDPDSAHRSAYIWANKTLSPYDAQFRN